MKIPADDRIACHRPVRHRRGRGGGEDDAFTFTATGAFTGTAGELVSYVAGGNTYLASDTDGDGSADFIVRLDGVVDLTVGDFVL